MPAAAQSPITDADEMEPGDDSGPGPATPKPSQTPASPKCTITPMADNNCDSGLRLYRVCYVNKQVVSQTPAQCVPPKAPGG
jgi:hypothetical protein